MSVLFRNLVIGVLAGLFLTSAISTNFQQRPAELQPASDLVEFEDSQSDEDPLVVAWDPNAVSPNTTLTAATVDLHIPLGGDFDSLLERPPKI
jgi:hypothetical protein